MSLWSELKRRDVIRVVLAYGVLGWLLTEVSSVVLPTFGAPGWVMKVLIFVVLLGFIPTLIFSWVYELTPEGIRKESEITRDESISGPAGRKLNLAIVVLLLLTVAFLGYSWHAAQPARNRADGRTSTNETTARQDGRSIAVLPFVNMSSDPEQEYFSDGITEEILNTLVRVPGLLVTARTSTFSYKGRQADVRSIGKELGVGHILEGSVRKAGQQLRITAQLIRVSDGFHLWSQTYDRKLENIFAIQEQIATAIAEALKAPLGIASGQLIHNRMQNMEAYEKFLKARRLLVKRGEHLPEALHLLDDIVQQEAAYAPAWALLSVVREVLPAWSDTLDGEKIDLEANLAAAEVAARQAVALDPGLADGHHALANVLRDRGQWADAEDSYRRAFDLDSRSIDLLENYSEFLGEVGRKRAAIAMARRGYELEPSSALAAVALCDSLIGAQHLTEARAYCHTARQLQPDFVWPVMSLVQIALLEGDLETAYQLDAGCPRCADIDNGYGKALLKAIHDGVDPVPYDQRIFGVFDIAIWMHIGGQALILEGLNSQQERYLGHGRILFYLNPPYMDAIRSTPRFKQLVIDADLPAYWRQRGWPDMCHPLGKDDFECGAYHP